MPLPRGIGRFNRLAINPVLRVAANRLPPLAIVAHKGRESGRTYRTPVFAFPTGDGFIIALTYGRGTDWERNLFAASGGELVYRGRRHVVRDPAIVTAADAKPFLPALIRALLRVGGVTDFLRLEAVDGKAAA